MLFNTVLQADMHHIKCVHFNKTIVAAFMLSYTATCIKCTNISHHRNRLPDPEPVDDSV